GAYGCILAQLCFLFLRQGVVKLLVKSYDNPTTSIRHVLFNVLGFNTSSSSLFHFVSINIAALSQSTWYSSSTSFWYCCFSLSSPAPSRSAISKSNHVVLLLALANPDFFGNHSGLG
ncbi:hypothetical protein Tco_1126368, partial [Tanacetum coccineum]